MASLTFEGGLNEQDINLVNQSECIAGYNFELGAKNSHYNPRKPFDLLGTATNSSPIDGFVQLIKSDNTETTLVQAGATVYLWDGASTFTSKGTVSSNSRLRGTTWTLGGYSVISDLGKATVIQKWDGTSLTSLTTGLGSALYAKYGVVHLNRIWLFNVQAGTDTPHLFVASAFENPTSYDTSKRAKDSTFSTGNEAFYMTIPDGRPINGVSLFFGNLIISTESGSLWKLTGSSSLDFALIPYYPGSAAIGNESLVSIGDDVIYMKRDGVIESVGLTQTAGDVATNDLSRFIRTSVSGLTGGITIYDQSRQKVYLFCGSNKVLVFFKEMLESGLSPWTIYKTSHASSFSTNAAIYMRQPGGSNYYVYWGDSIGRIFKMDGIGYGDGGTVQVETHRKSRYIDKIEGLDLNLMRWRGRVEYRKIAACSLEMNFEWADDYAVNRCLVPLEGPGASGPGGYFGGPGYFGGLFYFNAGFQLALKTSSKGFSPIGRGPGFYVSLTVSSNQTFDITKISV